MYKHELANVLFNAISLSENNPDEDRMQAKFAVDTLIKLQQKYRIVLDSPARILWKVTGKCNCQCEHCWANLGAYSPTKEEVLRLAEEMGELNVFMVSISGGEPFIRDDLFDIIRVLKKYNIIVELMSNGSLITEKVADKLAKYLDIETDVVQISLDGPDSQTHDLQRNNSIFEKTILGIKNLRKHNIKVRVVCTATPINVDKLYDTYLLASKLGVQVFSVSPVFPLRKGKQFEHMLDEDMYLLELAKCVLEEKENNTKLRLQVSQAYQKFIFDYYDYLQVNMDKYSRVYEIYPTNANSFFQIDAFGNALPGPEYEDEYIAGNVYKSGIATIWKSNTTWPEFRHCRELADTKCSICKVYPICHGGNVKRAYEKYQTINAPDGDCRVMFNE